MVRGYSLVGGAESACLELRPEEDARRRKTGGD